MDIKTIAFGGTEATGKAWGPRCAHLLPNNKQSRRKKKKTLPGFHSVQELGSAYIFLAEAFVTLAIVNPNPSGPWDTVPFSIYSALGCHCTPAPPPLSIQLGLSLLLQWVRACSACRTMVPMEPLISTPAGSVPETDSCLGIKAHKEKQAQSTGPQESCVAVLWDGPPLLTPKGSHCE